MATFNARLKMERDSKINNGLLPPEAAFNPVGMFSTMSRMVATNSRPSSSQASPGSGGVSGSAAHTDSNMVADSDSPEGPTPVHKTSAFQQLEDELKTFRASFPASLADAIRPTTFGPLSSSSNDNGIGRNLKSVDGALYLAHSIVAL